MKSLFKIGAILTPKDIRDASFLGLAMLFGATLEAFGIGGIMPLLSIMGQPDYLEQHEEFAHQIAFTGITTHEQLIISGAWILLVVYIFKNVYLVYLSKWQLNFSMRLQVAYAKRLFGIYLQKPYLYHLDHNTATLLHKTYDGPQRIFGNLVCGVLFLFTEILASLAICLFLFFADPVMAVIVIFCFGVMMYGITRFFRDRIRRYGEIYNCCASETFQWVNQGMGSIKETKILGREAYFYGMYDEAYRKFGDAGVQHQKIVVMPRFVIEGTVVSGLLLMIMGEIYAERSPVELLPILGLLAMAAFRLMPSANRIINYWNSIKFQMPLLDELFDDFLLVREERINGEHAPAFYEKKTPMPFEHEISINHLRFHYPETEQVVLQDVSFVISKGSFVGIVGESGAGKTTFVDILLGLLSPTSGVIQIDGKDISEDIRAWQANLAYVPQDIYLLDSSIRENIALGVAVDEIDDERIKQVLQMAELETFIQSLPEGVHTIVGERGVKLSGGQRQRIGIARALYPQPKVLVLDEATSALDDATEKSITDTILKFKGKLTIIAIAHRLSTLSECDFKVCFENGQAKIVDRNDDKGASVV